MEKLIEQITQKVLRQLGTGMETSPQISFPPNVVQQTMPKEAKYQPIQMITGAEMARMIDHTLLKPTCTEAEIIKLCEEAKQHGFATVCVHSYWVPTAYRELEGSKVGITTVVGFPLGCTSTFAKVAEARDAIAAGATEIDMVMNLSAMKSGDLNAVKKDIESIVLVCKPQAIVKVILETGYLTDDEIEKASLICKMAGADFVKTSTGFGEGGATVHAIQIMRRAVGPEMGVKASGGVRDLDTARSLVQAGANRIGASSSVELVTGKLVSAKGY